MKSYKTRFLEKIERTPSAISYLLKTPDGFSFTAGQYMLVDLGNDLVHPLSLSDCPEEREFIEFTKRMTGSPYCNKLTSLEQGEEITVNGPAGKFICEQREGSLVMIAGGIGITPLRSILKSLVKSGGGPDRITLLYGNLNKEDIAFRDELEHLALSNFRLIHVLSDNTGMANAHKGFITGEIIKEEIPEFKRATYMISGPPGMVDAMKKALAVLEVRDEQIHTDMFMGYD